MRLLLVMGCMIVPMMVLAQNCPVYESFDVLDTTRWTLQLYSFDGNGCNFVSENVSTENSLLSLCITPNRYALFAKKYNGGEIFDRNFFHFGYFSVRMKSIIKKGTVSSFFLLSQPASSDSLQYEMDIEFLGKDLHAVQLSTHAIPDLSGQVKSTTKIIPLGFDVSAGFHTYGILWTPEYINWFVDDRFIYSSNACLPQRPMQIRMNHWGGDENHPTSLPWLGGAIDFEYLPSIVYYDWIKVFTLSEYYQLRQKQQKP